MALPDELQHPGDGEQLRRDDDAADVEQRPQPADRHAAASARQQAQSHCLTASQAQVLLGDTVTRGGCAVEVYVGSDNWPCNMRWQR